MNQSMLTQKSSHFLNATCTQQLQKHELTHLESSCADSFEDLMNFTSLLLQSVHSEAGNDVRMWSSCHTDAHIVQCILSNNTYLRRLYLSLTQAKILFPDLTNHLSAMSMSRKQRSRAVALKKWSHKILLVNENGQCSHAVFDCIVSSKRQLHCRITQGWSQFCQALGVVVGNSIVIEPVQKCALVLLVRIERKSAPSEVVQ